MVEHVPDELWDGIEPYIYEACQPLQPLEEGEIEYYQELLVCHYFDDDTGETDGDQVGDSTDGEPYDDAVRRSTDSSQKIRREFDPTDYGEPDDDTVRESTDSSQQTRSEYTPTEKDGEPDAHTVRGSSESSTQTRSQYTPTERNDESREQTDDGVYNPEEETQEQFADEPDEDLNRTPVEEPPKKQPRRDGVILSEHGFLLDMVNLRVLGTASDSRQMRS